MVGAEVSTLNSASLLPFEKIRKWQYGLRLT